MTAHPNAQILAQLAEIAKTDPEPWKRLEVQDVYGNWVMCGSQITVLNPNVILRIKPATVNIGGVELEGPLREVPEENTRLWVLFDHSLSPDKPTLEYFVGHEHTPPVKRTITLMVNGREWVLPEPLKGPIHAGRAYYVVGEDGQPSLRVWEHTAADKLCQRELRMHNTEAECQAWADFDKWCRGGGV